MTREHRALALLLLAFLAINGLTLSRYPSVWVDEIQFADPAINYASGLGFTSTAWFAQDSTQFWAGNVPLYPMLLAAWLKLWGPTLFAERSLNLVLFTIFTLLIWNWTRRTAITAPWRLAVVALLCTAHAMVFSYRSGRYDVTGMLLAAAALNLWEKGGLPLFAIGLLIPAAGLQLIPSTLVLCTLATLIYGRPALTRAATLTTGTAAGAIGLWAFYSSLDVWQGFRASTSAIGLIGHSIPEKLKALPAIYTHDKSFVILAIALAILATKKPTKPILLTALIATILPAALHLAGKFPIYYSWMIFLPVLLAVAQIASHSSQTTKYAITAALTLAALVGLPLRLAGVATAWSPRDPQHIDEFLKANITQGETVLADFKTYYALRANGNRPLLPTYLPAIRPEEQSAVTALIIKESDAPAIQSTLGGAWQPTGAKRPSAPAPPVLKRLIAELREEDYTLTLYRRASWPYRDRRSVTNRANSLPAANVTLGPFTATDTISTDAAAPIPAPIAAPFTPPASAPIPAPIAVPTPTFPAFPRFSIRFPSSS
jgi:hypothetical protein